MSFHQEGVNFFCDHKGVILEHSLRQRHVVSANETTLIGHVSDIVRIRVCGSNFVTLKE
jgi:hypothetical protein